MHSQEKPRWRGGRFLFALSLALVANGAYLAAYGDPTLFYIANSLLHPILGVVVAVLFATFAVRNRSQWAGVTGRGALACLVLGTGFGIQLMIVGMVRPNAWALYLHVGLTIAGLFLLLLHFRARVQ